MDHADHALALQLHQAAETLWPQLQPLLGSPNYTGVVVLIQSVDAPELKETHQIGEPPMKHIVRHRELAAEKIARMIATDQHSSWSTRDPWHAKLGGGIRAGSRYIAVCGLTEHGDETLALAIALHAGLLTKDEAEAIAAAGHNMLFSTFTSAQLA